MHTQARYKREDEEGGKKNDAVIYFGLLFSLASVRCTPRRSVSDVLSLETAETAGGCGSPRARISSTAVAVPHVHFDPATKDKEHDFAVPTLLRLRFKDGLLFRERVSEEVLAMRKL